MSRILLVVAIAAVLAGLLFWQHRREQLVATCIAGGGVWNGSRSTCEAPPPRPILQRDLHRS